MIDAYQPPTFSHSIDLDLSRNEGRPLVEDVDFGEIDIRRVTSRYPDTSRLRELIASRHGVGIDGVLVTAGSDDAIFRTILSVRGRAVSATTPSFEMIGRYAYQCGSPLREVRWWAGEFPVDEFVAVEDPGLAVVVSPNNPTGSVMSAEELGEVSAAFPLVLLDGAYEEFADRELTPRALELGNVVIARTLSKAWGLAGLRVGYLLGSPASIQRIAGFGSPFAVSSLSVPLACRTLLERASDMDSYVALVVQLRSRLAALLEELGRRSLPSQGNFVLVTSIDAAQVVADAAVEGIGLRAFPERDELTGCVRMTVPGDDEAYRRLEMVLRRILRSEKGNTDVA